MARGDGGGLGRLGHVADDAVGGDSEYTVFWIMVLSWVEKIWDYGVSWLSFATVFLLFRQFGAAGKATQLPYVLQTGICTYVHT